MTDGPSRIVVAAMAALVLAVLGFWLWRSESTVVPGAPAQQSEASDTATLTASKDVAVVPVERTEAPVPPVPVASVDLAHIRGRCVDETGRPLANGTARFDGRPRNSQDMAMQGKVEWKDPEPVITGADGRFDIAFAPPAGFQFGLDIQADGRVPRTGWWGTIAPTQVIDLGDVAMVAGFEVRGRIVDEQGAPVVEAAVMLRNLPLPLAPDMSANNTRHGFSTATGDFRLEVPIPPGTWPLGLDGRGVRLLSPDAVTVTGEGADPVQITVRRMPSIEGSVVDEQGQPVAGVYLNVELHRSGRMASAWSAKDGTFVIHAVDAEPKPVKLVVSDPGPCEPSWADERLWEWGSKNVRIVLKRALSFELMVVERGSGAPVTQYAVICDSNEPRSRGVGGLRLAGEHRNGRVTVDRVSRGKNVLYVVPIDRALQPSSKVEFEASDAGVATIRVEVERLPRGTVRATTPGGESVVGSMVEVVVKGTDSFDATSHVQDPHKGRGYSTDPSHRFHELTSSGMTGGDGRAEVFAAPDVRGLVVRVTGAHPPVVVDPALFVSGRDLVVVVPESGGIVGKVTLRGLEPANVAVGLQLVGDQELRRRDRNEGVLRSDGTFALRGLAPGGYRLLLRHAVRERTAHGGSVAQVDLDVNVPEVTVVAGRDTEVEIDATALAPATLRGRVLLDGAVPSAVRVSLTLERGGAFGQFLPGDDGVFEATGLLPGVYRAVLVVGDFRAGEGERIVADDTFVLAAGEHVARDLQFTRRRLVVTILQADGKTRAAGQRLFIRGLNLFGARTADAEGVLVIDPAPTGPIDVQAVGVGLLHPVGPLEIPVGQSTHEVTLTLTAPPRSK